jgi:hypothetical protein
VVKSRVRSKVGAEVKGEKEGAKVLFPDTLGACWCLAILKEAGVEAEEEDAVEIETESRAEIKTGAVSTKAM